MNRKTCVEFALKKKNLLFLDFIKTVAANAAGTHCVIISKYWMKEPYPQV
jgi:hypothetical protein